MISTKMRRGIRAQGIPDGYVKAILKDFKPLLETLNNKKPSQTLIDGMFSIFLTGNLNAVDLETKFGYMMSPFVGTHYERNGSRSRTKSAK